MNASDLVHNPASAFTACAKASLLISLPLPPCGRLVLALPSVGLVGALAGAPFCFASLFLLFFLLSGIAPGFEVDGDLPDSRSGYPFWLKANCDPF